MDLVIPCMCTSFCRGGKCVTLLNDVMRSAVRSATLFAALYVLGVAVNARVQCQFRTSTPGWVSQALLLWVAQPCPA